VFARRSVVLAGGACGNCAPAKPARLWPTREKPAARQSPKAVDEIVLFSVRIGQSVQPPILSARLLSRGQVFPADHSLPSNSTCSVVLAPSRRRAAEWPASLEARGSLGQHACQMRPRQLRVEAPLRNQAPHQVGPRMPAVAPGSVSRAATSKPAGKPSLFPLFCCGTRQNTSEPKTHC
jgi:hypothetical protein